MIVNITLAQEADADTIMAMMLSFYAEEGLELSPGARQALGLLLGDPALGSCFLIRRDDRVVGYGVIALGFSLEFGGRDAFLDELYIIPEARGLGLGRQALNHALAWCAQAGIHALHLEVSRKNAAAQGLYRGCGFRERHQGYDLLTRRIG